MSSDTALIMGAGAFGTSIACVLSENFKKVIVKVRSQDIYDSIKNGENSIIFQVKNYLKILYQLLSGMKFMIL